MNRVICVITEETRWEPMWVLQRGDGSIFLTPKGGWAYFSTMRDITRWIAERQISPVELPAGVLYRQDRV